MDIKIGEYYANKTWRFMLPTMRGHGTEFVKKFNPVFKLAVGIKDIVADQPKLTDRRGLYLLCDKQYQTQNYQSFLDWVKDEPFYIDDYCPEANFADSRKHMIVLEVPEEFNPAYDYFLKGKYSKMFTTEQVTKLFSSDVKKPEKDILFRNYSEGVLVEYIRKVNKRFNTTLNTSDFNFIDGELELPPENEEEVFNYDYVEEKEYFTNTTDRK